jgi:hypothetical protein
MYRVVPSGRPRRVRTLLIAVALLGLLGAMAPMAGSHSVIPTSPHAGPALATTPHPVSTHRGASAIGAHVAGPGASSTAVSPRPATASGTGTFWIANSSFSSLSFANNSCSSYSSTTYFSSTCFNQAVSPTLLNLSNGDVAIVFSIYTNESSTSCVGSASAVRERVAFAISTNDGASFGPMQILGNSTCTYLDAIEPSFVVAPNGVIYGVYVEENYSANQGEYTVRNVGVGCTYYYYYSCYGDGADALGFTESTDNGLTFSTPVTILSSGNISKPQMAIDGQSLYVLYENDTNGTAATYYGQYGYNTGDPISENLLFSSNSGATWSGPVDLPGENSSANNTALGGSLAVNSAGLIGVAYFTNHNCVAPVPYYNCYDAGDDLVYTTSTNNGTTWSPLVTVASSVGESYEYPYGYYLQAFFQVIPQAALSFDGAGLTAYITWAGTYNKSALNGQPYWYYDNWNQGGIFAAVGPSSGTGFTVSSVFVPTSQYDIDSSYNPTIAESSGTIYVAYTTANQTSCASCPSPLDGSYIESMQTSTDGGLTWSSPTLLSYSNDCYYGYCATRNADNSFSGYSSSLAFTANASPLVAYALPFGFQYTYSYNGVVSYYNYTYATELDVASIWSGPTVSVNFTENDLAPGTTWSFSVNGNVFSTNQPSFTVTNVPLSQQVAIAPGAVQLKQWGAISTPTLSVPASFAFGANSTVFINFSLSYLLTLAIEPTNVPYGEIHFDYGVDHYYYEEVSGCPYSCGTENYYQSSYSWYFPANVSLEMGSNGNFPAEQLNYWTGLGNGSFTGSGGDANITFNGAINETVWQGGFGEYNLSVSAAGIPSSSTYYFALDGVQYSAAGGSLVNVSGVGTGAHEITSVWATSTTAGWEYFGQPSPANPVLIPTETSVALKFALIDVGASPGTISFQAQGLTSGTVWAFEFNGTVYSSDTPWINVSAHPGTYNVAGFPVTAENASAGYTPSGVGPTLSVTVGSTYPVSFLPAYKVQVIAGTGGGVTGGTGAFWVAAGAAGQFVASAHAGYAFGGWSGSGVGNYTGLSSYANITANGPIVETASFYPLPGSRFNLTFAETGLAPGTWWSVFLSGSGFSTNTSTLEVQNLLPCGVPGGTYNLSVPYAYSSNDLTRFLPSSHLPRAVCTTGTTVYNEVFSAEYYLTLQSTAGGFAEAQVGSNIVAASIWVGAGTSVTLTAAGQVGYDFLGWNGTGSGSYTGPNVAQTILMAGPITELSTFSLHVIPPAPTYSVTFHEQQTLAAGTVWSIVFGGVGYSSTTSTLTVSHLTATSYTLTVNPAYSPDGLTRYSTLGNAPSVAVAHNITNQPITFSTSYWVSVSGTFGGTTSPGSGWVTSGSSIFLNVSEDVGFNFVGWNGTGAAAYTGDVAATTVTVSSPISEVATFAPTAKTVATGTAGTTLWSQPTTWIALGIVGLIVGLVVGLVVSRRGGRSPPPMTPYEGPSEGAGAPGPDASEGGAS